MRLCRLRQKCLHRISSVTACDSGIGVQLCRRVTQKTFDDERREQTRKYFMCCRCLCFEGWYGLLCAEQASTDDEKEVGLAGWAIAIIIASLVLLLCKCLLILTNTTPYMAHPNNLTAYQITEVIHTQNLIAQSEEVSAQLHSPLLPVLLSPHYFVITSTWLHNPFTNSTLHLHSFAAPSKIKLQKTLV